MKGKTELKPAAIVKVCAVCPLSKRIEPVLTGRCFAFPSLSTRKTIYCWKGFAEQNWYIPNIIHSSVCFFYSPSAPLT